MAGLSTQNVTTPARTVLRQIQATASAATQKIQILVTAGLSSRSTLVLKSALLDATTTQRQTDASFVIQHVCLVLAAHKLVQLVVSKISCSFTRRNVWLSVQIGLLRTRAPTDARRVREIVLPAKVCRLHARLATKSPRSHSFSTRVASQAASLTLVSK